MLKKPLLIDGKYHYRFRSQHEESTEKEPLILTSDDTWTKRYYDPKNIKYKERKLLS